MQTVTPRPPHLGKSLSCGLRHRRRMAVQDEYSGEYRMPCFSLVLCSIVCSQPFERALGVGEIADRELAEFLDLPGRVEGGKRASARCNQFCQRLHLFCADRLVEVIG